jgi:dimethyladenosine transferase
MSKKFGQNFLLPVGVRRNIVSRLELKEGMTAWEVGPGFGSLTSLSLATGARVKAFEIDRGFCRVLTEKAFSDEENFSLVEGDSFETLFKEPETPDVLYGNLPYNVGSKLITTLVEKGLLPSRMVFMLQKEVVERMLKDPEKSDFPLFSALTRLDYENEYAFTVARSCFYPEPNVDSAVVVMRKRENSHIPESLRPVFFSVVPDLYQARRKTVRNNLSAGRIGKLGGKEMVEALLQLSGLEGSERAEKFSFDDLLKITRAAAELI